LRDARGFTDATIDKELAALAAFEAHTRRRDFAGFRNSQASSFKDHLATSLNGRTRTRLSDSTQLHSLSALRKFFIWLADQNGYRGRLKRSDADYFRPARRQAAIARTVRNVEGPTVEQVQYVLRGMPDGTDVEKRDRALIAFALLTGARDNAIASLRLKHVNIPGRMVMQDARDVRTKASKTIETWFFPIGADVEAIVRDWVEFLKRDRLWGLDDPLFPKTLVRPGASRRFEPAGLERGCWSDPAPIRSIFKREFERAGLPYFNPHSFRKTLARLGQATCQTPEQFKAWSQNLGHDDVLTTLTSYGQIDRLRQREVILSFGN
jgi:integrase